MYICSNQIYIYIYIYIYWNGLVNITSSYLHHKWWHSGWNIWWFIYKIVLGWTRKVSSDPQRMFITTSWTRKSFCTPLIPYLDIKLKKTEFQMKYFIFVTYRPIVNLSNNMLVYKLLNVRGWLAERIGKWLSVGYRHARFYDHEI